MSPKTPAVAALSFLEAQGLLSIGHGDEWAMELTLDSGKQKRSKDFRPDLSLLVQY
jgi:hypothetical protein